MHMLGGRLKDQSGFTLVELIITATYVAAASGAIVGIFITISQLNRLSRNLASATAAAQQQMEIYRDGGYASVPLGDPAEDFTDKLPSQLASPRSATTAVTEIQPGLKKVVTKIRYTDGNKEKNVQMTTMIAQRGISR